MIRPLDRKLALFLVRTRIWKLKMGMFRQPQIVTRRGTRWIYDLMKKRQAPEDKPYHHAPACPANRWAGQALVFQYCTCGAVKHGIVSKGYC